MAHGQMTHLELPADDPARARKFYEGLLGWEFGEMEGFPDYWLFRSSEGSGGGLGKRGESVSNVIRVYVTVDKLETAVAAAEANGGSVIEPPADVPGQGRYAVVRDPEGSEIGLWESAPG